MNNNNNVIVLVLSLYVVSNNDYLVTQAKADPQSSSWLNVS